MKLMNLSKTICLSLCVSGAVAWINRIHTPCRSPSRLGVLNVLEDGIPEGLKSAIAAGVQEDVTTKKSWYPTRIQEILPTDDVVALRLRHILFETRPLAFTCLEQLRAGTEFDTLAKSISLCETSRKEGGFLGWVSPEDEYLDDTLPAVGREKAFTYKPGDMFIAETDLGFHIIKVEDSMTRLRTKSTKRGKMPGSGDTLLSLADQLSADENKTPTYVMETMGCQMNVADTERMAGQLDDIGIQRLDTDLADKRQKPNVVILNTCSIRDHAEQKVYSALGPHAIRKRKGEPVVIVVAGCVAQQEGQNILRRFPEVDLVMGPQYANRIGDLLEDVMNGNQVVATDPLHIMEDVSKPRRGSTTCAWVNVIYGCNEHCTYCVVPTTRGVEQSRPREAIRKEIEDLAKSGYKEITLLGQNIDAWGRDMSPKQKFSDLLLHVADVPGIERVRFVTSHPRYMSDRVVDAVASEPKLCEVFHVPFQSGDNTVLARMRRGYTRERYLQIVKRIRDRFGEEASITGDVIVGFPGETDEQFENTMRLMEEVGFDACMTAAYSPRPNTDAAEWADQVPEDVKQERLQRVQRLATTCAMERSAKYMGRTEEVLVEELNTKNPKQVMGRTRTNRKVFFDGSIETLKGKLVPVTITEVRPFSLTGTLVAEDSTAPSGSHARELVQHAPI